MWFQYQQKVEPLVPLAAPEATAQSWLPRFPDRLALARLPLSVYQFFAFWPEPIPPSPSRVTQAVWEATVPLGTVPTAVTQAVWETLFQQPAQARVTQAVWEIIIIRRDVPVLLPVCPPPEPPAPVEGDDACEEPFLP